MDLPPEPHAPSLIDRLRFARPAGMSGSARSGGLVAALLIAAPLMTIGGATLLAAGARSDAAAILNRAQAKIETQRQVSGVRGALVPLLGRPGVGATLEALARVLPAEASVVRVECENDGRRSIDVAAPDPDRARAALRRDPATDDLRDVRQRTGDGAMIVTFESGR